MHHALLSTQRGVEDSRDCSRSSGQHALTKLCHRVAGWRKPWLLGYTNLVYGISYWEDSDHQDTL